jgi:hypothetical protein
VPTELLGNKVVFHTESLTKGIYLIQVDSGNRVDSRKIIIQ